MKKSMPHLYIPARCLCALCGAAVPLISNAAENWDIGYQPHVEIGVVDYTLDVSAISQLGPLVGGATSAGKLSFGATMPTASAGLTLFVDRFFLDLSAQRMETLNQNMSDSHTIISASPAVLTTVDIDIGYDTDDFSRDEYALSLGYGLTESVSVYVGYKRQYTTLNQLGGTAPVQLLDGSQIGATFTTVGDFKFDYDGPFVGGTTSWKIASNRLTGRLAFSAAVAFLQGSLHVESDSASVTANNGGAVLEDDVQPSDLFDTAGDAVGITLGASWVGQTNIAKLSYSVAVNGYSYDFSADDEGRADISEDVLQLKVGLAYAL